MLLFPYIVYQVPTDELNHQRLEYIILDLLQFVLSVTKQFLLLKLVSCCFRLQVTHSRFISIEPEIHVLVIAT